MSDEYPPTQPKSRLGSVLETLAPAILAAVAAKQGGPRAAGAVLETTNRFAAQDQQEQQRQAQIAETHQQVEQQRLDREAQQSQAQKQQAANFRVQAMNTLREITDPTEWTATANQLDDVYSQTFGAPAGTIKNGLSFSDAGALAGDQKAAEGTLTALEKRYGKSELWQMNPTVQFKGKPTKYRDLVQMAGLTAQTEAPDSAAAPEPASMPPQATPDPEAKTQGSFDAQFNDVLATREATIGRKLRPNERAELRLQSKKQYDAANDRPGSGASGTVQLSDDAVDLGGAYYRITGKLPSFGIAGGGDDKKRIMNAGAAQAKLLKQTPAMTIQKQAAYKADSAALQKMTAMSSAAEAFESKALGQADIVAELSNKVARTQFPIINAALLAGQANILGDTNTQQLYNAIQTFSTEYAKIMEGSTGSASASTESARHAAERLISAKLNKGTLLDVLALMKKEMQLTINGYDAVKQEITERMGGAAQPDAAPVNPTDRLGILGGP